jgi:hypothetical protein
MLVSDTLLVASDTLDGKKAIFFAEETCVKLTVGNDPEEDKADADGQASGDQKDDLPGFNGGPVQTCSFCDSICYQTAEDLCKAVE